MPWLLPAFLGDRFRIIPAVWREIKASWMGTIAAVLNIGWAAYGLIVLVLYRESTDIASLVPPLTFHVWLTVFLALSLIAVFEGFFLLHRTTTREIDSLVATLPKPSVDVVIDPPDADGGVNWFVSNDGASAQFWVETRVGLPPRDRHFRCMFYARWGHTSEKTALIPRGGRYRLKVASCLVHTHGGHWEISYRNVDGRSSAILVTSWTLNDSGEVKSTTGGSVLVEVKLLSDPMYPGEPITRWLRFEASRVDTQPMPSQSEIDSLV
jgi:hypothetical protein